MPRCMQRAGRDVKKDCERDATHEVSDYFVVAKKGHRSYYLCEEHGKRWNALHPIGMMKAAPLERK